MIRLHTKVNLMVFYIVVGSIEDILQIQLFVLSQQFDNSLIELFTLGFNWYSEYVDAVVMKSLVQIQEVAAASPDLLVFVEEAWLSKIEATTHQ